MKERVELLFAPADADSYARLRVAPLTSEPTESARAQVVTSSTEVPAQAITTSVARDPRVELAAILGAYSVYAPMQFAFRVGRDLETRRESRGTVCRRGMPGWGRLPRQTATELRGLAGRPWRSQMAQWGATTPE
ncbi:hypothetical protein [Nocardia sp. NPDC049526]|uniref:hypothetical protein n=1 Tax=Nocardia sp. NPDC049526 TaxID=3364316 RepID=UPI00378DFB67